MKITQYRENDGKYTQRALEMDAVLKSMKTETKQMPVSRLRHDLQYIRPSERSHLSAKLPVLIFGGLFLCKDGGFHRKQYNGIVLLEVNRLGSFEEVERVKKCAKELPQTLVAFTGSSGRSVKILVSFVLPDGTLPAGEEQISFFHAHAYRMAVCHYQPHLPAPVEKKKPLPERGCRMSFDPDLYYCPDALPIRLEQPVGMPEDETVHNDFSNICETDRLLPNYNQYTTWQLLYNRAMYDAQQSMGGTVEDENLQPLFTALAHGCFLAGIPEENAVQWTIRDADFREMELLVRTSFRVVYMRKKRSGKRAGLDSAVVLMEQLDEFMKRRYRFRRNMIKNSVEYMEPGSFRFDYRPIDKIAVNSIVMNALSEGIKAWDKDVMRYIESDRVKSYHPITDYLYSLPDWDGKDRIRELANRVPCNNPLWADYFYRWFVSMVTHWLGRDRNHGNSTTLLLIGKQGDGKSTFCRNLLSHELRSYYTDSVEFGNRREAELSLNRFALINLDEFDSYGERQQAFLKHILQKASVQARRPYGSVVEEIRRYATFIATCNDMQPLTDPTGSRRYICINLTGQVDYSQPIDYEMLYAQAMDAVKHGEQYWFTHEEEAEIMKNNLDFQQISSEEEILKATFRMPAEGETFESLSVTRIVERMKELHKHLKYDGATVPKVGKILIKNHFTRIRTKHGVFYQVVEMIGG